MNHKKAKAPPKTNRQFVPNPQNFKVSESYEGLELEIKPRTLEELKEKYSR